MDIGPDLYMKVNTSRKNIKIVHSMTRHKTKIKQQRKLSKGELFVSVGPFP